MTIGHLLSRFTGRISRPQFWSAMAMFYLPVFPLYLYFFVSEVQTEPGWSDGTRFNHLHPHDFAATIFVFYPLLAISVKRLHDIGRSGWWSLPMIVTPVVTLYTMMPMWHRGTAWSHRDPWNNLVWSPPALWIGLGVIALVLLAWWVIELGTRPGTPGPNRFGPPSDKAIGSAEDAPRE